jgi:FO synthase
LNELVNHLLNSSLEDVAKEAVKIRTAVYGTNITYSPKIFIPLTKLCRDNCKYCTFAKPPKRLDKPSLEMDEIIKPYLRSGKNQNTDTRQPEIF